MPRRTLAEELAELATTGPAPDLDPEADAFGEGPALVDSDGDGGGAPLGARRLRGDIGDLGVEYVGRRTSAAAAFGDGNPSEEHPAQARGSDAESSASEENDLALIGAGEPDGTDSDLGSPGAALRCSLQQSEATANGRRRDGGDSSSDDSGSQDLDQQQRRRQAVADGAESSGDGDSDDAAADDADAAVARMMAAAAGGRAFDAGAKLASVAADGTQAGAESPNEDDDRIQQPLLEADGKLEALEREFDAVAAADADAAAGLASKAQADWRRGVAAGRQRRLWERALEVRIRAQRAVATAHRLPGPEAHAVAAASPQLSPAFAAAAEAAAAAVGELLQLQRALLDQNPAVAEAAEAAAAAGGGQDAGSRKRGQEEGSGAAASQATADLWRQIEDTTAAWAPYRDASLDRWHRRAALSGGAAAACTGLKALAQPLSAQVAAALAVPGRLLARSQLPRDGAPPVLCEPPAAADGPEAAPTEHGNLTDGAAGSDGQRRLAHTYDDADLYEQLLKEYLEGAGAPGGGAATLQRAPKRRKVVDRRASKGRKLRFHVHDKLVNFMTPANSGMSGEDGVGAALFTNLFGQRQQPAAAAQLA